MTVYERVLTGALRLAFVVFSDRPAPHDRVTAGDLSPPSVANGTMPQSEENGSDGENGTTSHAVFLMSHCEDGKPCGQMVPLDGL